MSLGSKVAFFRCDGVSGSGLGHVSRCLALAEAFQEAGLRCFFFGQFEAGASALLRAAEMPFDHSPAPVNQPNDLSATLDMIRNLGASLAVVDSYLADERYIAEMHHDGAPVTIIDDFARLAFYECAAILNFTVNAPHLKYVSGQASLVLGPQYLLVRRRLRRCRPDQKPRHGAVRRVLIAIGGEDLLDLSYQVAGALLQAEPGLDLHAVVAKNDPRVNDMVSLLGRYPGQNRLIMQLADLAQELSWADMGVCGGGLTKYEAAYLGLPVAVIDQTGAQSGETVFFARQGLAVALGQGSPQLTAQQSASLVKIIRDETLRQALSQAGLDFFPLDPTRNAAECVLQAVDAASASRSPQGKAMAHG